MIKNNILMVILQILMSLFWMGFIILIGWNSELEKLFYGSVIIRFIISCFVVSIFYFLGKLLKKNLRLTEILFSGLLSLGITGIFFLLAYIGEGDSLLDGSVASSLWRVPMDFYLLPQTYIVHLIGFADTWLGYGFILGTGSFVMELSLLHSHIKYKRLKKIRKNNRG